MRSLRASFGGVMFGVSLVLTAGTVSGADISGTISSTLTITEDSQLVGNVICTVTAAPCIAFGASGVTLKLNGFSITGRADSVTGCGGTGVGEEAGILVDRVRGAVIQGPGIVQRFRGHGVQIGTRAGGSTRVFVTLVTASTNCFSGFIVFGPSSDNDLDANTSVRNGNGGAPCGGIWLTSGSSRSRLRANRLSGNGYAVQTPLPGGTPNSNFGIGVFGVDNEIVDNIAVGNANGIILFANVTGNTVRKNLVVGNPPVQISVNNPATTGVDIRNDAPPGSNIIEDNVCLTAVNAPCPAVDDTPPRAR